MEKTEEKKETLESQRTNNFKADLMRTFKQLKESRAEGVAEDVEIVYKRKIEDLVHSIRNLDRDRENMILDLSPTSAFNGSVVPSDFNAASFCEKDLEIGRKKRDAVISLGILMERYEHLFGKLENAMAENILSNNKNI